MPVTSSPPRCRSTDEVVSTLGEGTFGKVVECKDTQRSVKRKVVVTIVKDRDRVHICEKNDGS